MGQKYKGSEAPASAPRPSSKTSPADSTPAASYIARIRGLLPAGAVVLYGGPTTPACDCMKTVSCRTCQAYDAAGRGIEQAAAALRAPEAR